MSEGDFSEAFEQVDRELGNCLISSFSSWAISTHMTSKRKGRLARGRSSLQRRIIGVWQCPGQVSQICFGVYGTPVVICKGSIESFHYLKKTLLVRLKIPSQWDHFTFADEIRKAAARNRCASPLFFFSDKRLMALKSPMSSRAPCLFSGIWLRSCQSLFSKESLSISINRRHEPFFMESSLKYCNMNYTVRLC